MTLDRNTLAHTLVRFYVAHSSILALLECLIMKEVNDTSKLMTVASVFIIIIILQPMRPRYSGATLWPPNALINS